MEPENHSTPQQPHPSEDAPETGLLTKPPSLNPDNREFAWLVRIFIGPQGLRAGWSTLLFVFFTTIFMLAAAAVVAFLTGVAHHGKPAALTPLMALITEAVQLLAILFAGVLMARIERCKLRDYFLSGRRRLPHFFSGFAFGFIALSALVGALAWGHWIHFGPVALSGAKVLGSGAAWAVVFLLTALFEEGSFRCYLQFTLTRGINFWWALGIAGAACLDLVLRRVGDAGWGVYIVALLGLLPCLWLHLQPRAGSAFWQAAWATSTVFGFLHITNSGENWIGIFCAAAIGFVFCVSIWVTGSAWWAIGCHAAWDWAQTFFYGTANSGLTPKGHFLTTAPAGNVLWSGGTDGPEGSILILGVLALLVVTLIVLYGRKRAVVLPEPPAQRTVN